MKEKLHSLPVATAASDVDLRPIELDILSDHSIGRAVKRIVSEQGRIDVLIHNAAHLYIGITEAFAPEQIVATL